MTRYVAKNLRPKQHAWNKATQDRINKVVSILSSIKIVKMLGVTEVVKSQISDSRRIEIDASKDMRWVSVLANASGMFLERHLIRFYTRPDWNSKCARALHASNYRHPLCCIWQIKTRRRDSIHDSGHPCNGHTSC